MKMENFQNLILIITKDIIIIVFGKVFVNNFLCAEYSAKIRENISFYPLRAFATIKLEN